MKRMLSFFPHGPWYAASFMSPKGGYLFLYPGSTNRIFLSAMVHYFESCTHPRLSNQFIRLVRARDSSKPFKWTGTRPVEMLCKLRKFANEIMHIGFDPLRHGFAVEIGGNAGQAVDADSFGKEMPPSVVPL